MSSAIKKRLWSQIWDPAWQFTRFEGAPKTSFSRSTFTNPSRQFSWNRPRPQYQAPRRTHVTRSFASCGFLLFDLSPTAASSTITPCTTTAEKTLYTSAIRPRPSIFSYTQQTWRREIHSSNGRRQRGNARRNKSSTSSSVQNVPKGPQNGTSKSADTAKKPEPPNTQPPSSNYLHLPHLPHMPKMPHRPTKEELLGAATGFWSRLKVRFKWFSIRSVRPWNIDDWSAFVSWFVLGNIVWILVGTTTFFSLVIFSINTVVAQGMLVKPKAKHSTFANKSFRNASKMDR